MKTESQHTPGPWKTMPMDGGGISINQIESEHYNDLSVAGCYGNYEVNEANAALIASAPDMLQALEDARITIQAFLPDAWATLQVIDSAINKAKGI